LFGKTGGERRTGCGIAGVLTGGVYQKIGSEGHIGLSRNGRKRKSAPLNQNLALYNANQIDILEIFE
jgi:hypothetical protein